MAGSLSSGGCWDQYELRRLRIQCCGHVVRDAAGPCSTCHLLHHAPQSRQGAPDVLGPRRPGLDKKRRSTHLRVAPGDRTCAPAPSASAVSSRRDPLAGPFYLSRPGLGPRSDVER